MTREASNTLKIVSGPAPQVELEDVERKWAGARR